MFVGHTGGPDRCFVVPGKQVPISPGRDAL